MYVSINSALHARVPSLYYSTRRDQVKYFWRHARIFKFVGWTANSWINHGFKRTCKPPKCMVFPYHFILDISRYPCTLFYEIKYACLFLRMKWIMRGGQHFYMSLNIQKILDTEFRDLKLMISVDYKHFISEI